MSKHLSWRRRLCDPLSLAGEKDQVTLSPAVPGLLGADLSPHPGQDPKGDRVQPSPPVNPLHSSSFYSGAPSRALAALRKPSRACQPLPTLPSWGLVSQRASQNAPPCPLPKLSCPAEIRYLPPPKQLKMTWAIFALGSRCKLPLELTASHIPLDHCPLLFIPHQEPPINRTGGLLETTGLSLLDGATEAMRSQAWGWAENQASWVSAQVSFYCLAQPAPYPRSQSL